MLSPDIKKSLQKLEITTNRSVTSLFSGNYKSAFKGRGVEFSDIREYAPGDDMRMIDWRTSAKKDELYVKKFQETRELSMIFLIDGSGSMFFGSEHHTKIDILLHTVAMLALSALKSNDRVGAFFFQEDIIEMILPRKGRSHFWRLLSAVEALKTHMIYAKSNTTKALQHIHKTRLSRSIIFLLTDQIDPHDETLIKWLRITASRHDLVVGKITDPLEQSFPQSGLFHLEDPETGEKALIDFSHTASRQRFEKAMKKGREEERKLFKKLGIDVLELSHVNEIFQKLYLFFKQRQARY
ncbi:MAG TPA: DUF58 domain-containing protein [Candidatus Gracilibacteria bacterium]